ncbi:MAG: transcriptional repressor LexA [Planctomycetota bacterium]|nr:transcriptional repressor LexA [Planctomycetota bacterium]MDG1983568.1 transcriptional repressor LexA [Planctomycetota bacterium]
MSNLPLTRRQQDILQFLRTYVEDHGISPTLEEIAAQFGVNKVTIFGHVAEMERKGVIRRRAKGVSRSLEVVDQESDQGSGVSLPVLGKIAAGSPIETIEEPELLNFADLVPDGKDVYALEVQGESMIEDAIADGDIVLIERRPSARDGETVVAVLPDGDATLKRFYREGNQFRLQPANSTMSPIIVDEVEIRGVVIGVVRKY